MKKEVYIQKVDMDTALTAFILGVTRTDDIFVLSSDAGEDILLNPEKICIEAGGSGMTELNNYDHHDPDNPMPPACLQAFKKMNIRDKKIKELVDYVVTIDEGKMQAEKAVFPSLSSVFSGMLLVEKEPKEQLFKGIEIFQDVIERNINPWGKIPEVKKWNAFIEAKKNNIEELKRLKDRVTIFISKNGLKIGFLETKVIGALKTIYKTGCDIAVAYTPDYNGVAKYTIASHKIKVSHLIDILNSKESGWGGREKIIGSPRTGSCLKPEEVIDIVREFC